MPVARTPTGKRLGYRGALRAGIEAEQGAEDEFDERHQGNAWRCGKPAEGW